jgi:DNA modification methylase
MGSNFTGSRKVVAPRSLLLRKTDESGYARKDRTASGESHGYPNGEGDFGQVVSANWIGGTIGIQPMRRALNRWTELLPQARRWSVSRVSVDPQRRNGMDLCMASDEERESKEVMAETSGLKRLKKKQSILINIIDKSSASPPGILASARRGRAERRGTHGWHPYYAGYSEAFVESAIGYLGCDEETILLDPWGGSGTTGFVASAMSVPSLCLDINPVMATFSAAKSLDVISRSDEIEWFFDTLSANMAAALHHDEHDPLLSMFEVGTAGLLREVINAVPFDSKPSNVEGSGGSAGTILLDRTQIIDAAYAFCIAVVFVTIREVSGTRALANPTWLKSASQKASRSPEQLIDELRANARRMLSDLKEFYHASGAPVPGLVVAGDARKLPLRSGTVDRIITSPPYLTRIDYAMSTLPEMAIFGDNKLLSHIRHQTMGAPVITKNERHQKAEWGSLCITVLDAIRAHPTKAASGYYWKNIVQYFIDLDRALDEIVRVLKPGGQGLIVVQSSYFKDVEILLGDIYVEMSRNKGLEASIAYREEIRGHLVQVNTKSSVYKKNKIYFEDFIHIQKPPKQDI